MKTIRTLLGILAMAAILISCEKKDDNLHITDLENKLAKAVDSYRTSVGLSTLTHDYNVVSRESKGHSEGWANGSITEANASDDLQQRWQNIENKFGVTNVSNPGILLMMYSSGGTPKTTAEIAEEVVAAWAADPDNKEVLEGDYTLQGPGEGQTSDGRIYITQIFLKFEQ